MASSPVDIHTMRTAAAALLDNGIEPPTGFYLSTLAEQLREYLKLLVRVLEVTSHATDDPRASAGLGEARRKLAAGQSSLGTLRWAQGLARSVNSLCTHAERLTVPE
ncbi:DUF6415 family natural product biosynthesis protein [Streptomyces sp. IB2014 016-6]|uniref:DUF6415 family natural product biosynthesis protein n=1 Tax=Streptomyces sp. IB2014 016-6 TaxID=2517818 RepID=UPI0011CC703C|nr:DUF6415 family natural product biosynthesis protein [Streptomyces sp. IB2014 016-6]TXL83965.1 hypothetical protein EW053_35980 [Streptomyces sp. IB2014 016-6]